MSFSAKAAGLVAVFDFGPLPQSQLNVKVAISAVSEANAIANLDAEAPVGISMRSATAAAAAWRDALGAVEIEAAEPVRKMLYTSLYHALMAPSIFMDVDGSYRGPDHEIHHARRVSRSDPRSHCGIPIARCIRC